MQSLQPSFCVRRDIFKNCQKLLQRKTFLIAWKIAAQKKTPEVCSADRALASAHQNLCCRDMEFWRASAYERSEC